MKCKYHCKGKECSSMQEVNGHVCCIAAACPAYSTLSNAPKAPKPAHRPTLSGIAGIRSHIAKIHRRMVSEYWKRGPFTDTYKALQLHLNQYSRELDCLLFPELRKSVYGG